MDERSKVFIFLFYLSFLFLSFSQFIFVPVGFFLTILILNFRDIFKRFSIEDYLFYFFIFFSIVSGIFAKDKSLAFGGVFILVLYYVFFVVGRGVNIDYEMVLKSSVVSVVLLSVFGLIFYLLPNLSVKLGIGGVNFVEIPPSKAFSLGGNFVRSPSITPNPVIFSSVVSYLMPFVVLHYFRKDRSWLFLLLLILIFIVVMFTSNTRVSVLLIFLGFVFMFYFLKAKREMAVFLFFFFLIFFVSVVVKNSLVLRFYSIVEGEDYTSFYNRLDSYRLGLDLFSKNFLFGLGLINFKEYVASYYGNYIHNIYLSILVETGVLGFLSFLSLIIALLVKLVKGFLETKDSVVFSVFVSVVLFLVHGFVDNPLYVVALGGLFWFLLGMGISRTVVKNF